MCASSAKVSPSSQKVKPSVEQLKHRWEWRGRGCWVGKQAAAAETNAFSSEFKRKVCFTGSFRVCTFFFGLLLVEREMAEMFIHESLMKLYSLGRSCIAAVFRPSSSYGLIHCTNNPSTKLFNVLISLSCANRNTQKKQWAKKKLLLKLTKTGSESLFIESKTQSIQQRWIRNVKKKENNFCWFRSFPLLRAAADLGQVLELFQFEQNFFCCWKFNTFFLHEIAK